MRPDESGAGMELPPTPESSTASALLFAMAGFLLGAADFEAGAFFFRGASGPASWPTSDLAESETFATRRATAGWQEPPLRKLDLESGGPCKVAGALTKEGAQGKA